MSYLTFEEFSKNSHTGLIEQEFDKLLPKASSVLDSVTNYFYVENDMEETNGWINTQFKNALIAQIEYFNELGSTTYESINNKPQSFSVGRTSVTNHHRSDNVEKKSIVAEEVYFYLSNTGLLFGGVNTI